MAQQGDFPYPDIPDEVEEPEARMAYMLEHFWQDYSFATAPALIIVGFYMMGSALKIDFSDPSEGIPAFLTILAMPTAYSISEGIAIGIISWTIINLVTGKAKEKKISPIMYVLTVLFIMKYIFL